MFGVGTCKMPTRRWNWTVIGANTKWAEVAIVFVWTLCAVGRSLIDNCNTALWALRLQPSWIRRIGSGEILGISREVSLAYREEIGHSLFPPVWHPHLQLACISNLDQIDENPSGKGKSGMYQHWQEIGPDCIFQRIFWRQALSPRAGNDPRKFVIIPPPLIRRITCKKHNEQEFSQFRCVQSINPGFLPSGRIINLSEYKKWEYVRGSHRLQLDGHLVTGLCITFITNEHSRERQGAVFRFLHLELLPLTIVCQVDRVGFA